MRKAAATSEAIQPDGRRTSPTMRTLNIIHVFRAPVGGLFRHVLDLVNGQVARGHRVGLVLDNLTGDARSAAILASLAPCLALGITSVPISRQLSPRDIGAVAHVGRRLRETRADVVHGHGAKGGAAARLAFVGRPIVRAYTSHGGSLLLDHSKAIGKAYLAMERALMSRGDLYLFESAYTADIFRNKLGTPRGLMRIVHNGISRAEFAPVPTAPDATDIVFVGEFRPVKGIDVLIEAIAGLHRQGLPLTATLVGDGPETAALRARVAAHGLSAIVRFMPSMAMREALQHGHLVVLPSRAESLPYVVLEAAAAGRPLITTRVGGIPEIYGPLSDALVTAGDVGALQRAIAAIVADPAAAAATADALRQRVLDFFSVDTMVDGIIAGYPQAIGGAPAAHRTVLQRA